MQTAIAPNPAQVATLRKEQPGTLRKTSFLAEESSDEETDGPDSSAVIGTVRCDPESKTVSRTSVLSLAGRANSPPQPDKNVTLRPGPGQQQRLFQGEEHSDIDLGANV